MLFVELLSEFFKKQVDFFQFLALKLYTYSFSTRTLENVSTSFLLQKFDIREMFTTKIAQNLP